VKLEDYYVDTFAGRAINNGSHSPAGSKSILFVLCTLSHPTFNILEKMQMGCTGLVLFPSGHMGKETENP